MNLPHDISTPVDTCLSSSPVLKLLILLSEVLRWLRAKREMSKAFPHVDDH